MSDFTRTPMTKIIQKGFDITIESEVTISTAQFENYKLKLSTTVNDFEDAIGVLNVFKRILDGERTKIHTQKEAK